MPPGGGSGGSPVEILSEIASLLAEILSATREGVRDEEQNRAAEIGRAHV